VGISVVRTLEGAKYGGVNVCLGEVAVTSQVVGYLRRRPSGEVIDHTPLDLPEQRLQTRAVWYTVSAELLGIDGVVGTGGHRVGTEASGVGTGEVWCGAPGGAGLTPARVPGALHAAEHTAIGLLPLFAACDRWDIGGVSADLHPATGQLTVFVYDGHEGGAGFAERGFAAARDWLAATAEAITCCECQAGCPSCIQS